MQPRGSSSPFIEDAKRDCVFCQKLAIDTYILKETRHFFLISDHAPLIPGHILIVPREHYACYGAMPAELDEELEELKREVTAFQKSFYAAPVFWEHGIFRQSVFHAHLHCFPFGKLDYQESQHKHQRQMDSQEDLRNWYYQHGQYFYMADSTQAYLFAPDRDHYTYIMQNILRPYVIEINQDNNWRSEEERRENGANKIQQLKENWQTFQKY